MFEDQFMTVQLKEHFGVFHVSAKIKTRPLHLKPRRACARVRRVLRTLPWHGACPVEPYLVDIDMFVDIVGLSDLEQVVAARDDRTRMGIHVTNLIPSGQEGLAGGGSFRWGADGRIRMYDKIAELNANPTKAAWMRSIYLDRGWNGSDPIARLEIRPGTRLRRTAVLAGRGWDLDHLWAQTLKPLRFIVPTQGMCPRQCPSTAWWNQVENQTFQPPWSVAPAPQTVAHTGLSRKASVALGQSRGALATILALSCLAGGVLVCLSPQEIRDVTKAGLAINDTFADVVAEKAVKFGVDRHQVRSSHLPREFRDDVLDAL